MEPNDTPDTPTETKEDQIKRRLDEIAQAVKSITAHQVAIRGHEALIDAVTEELLPLMPVGELFFYRGKIWTHKPQGNCRAHVAYEDPQFQVL